MRKSIAIDMDGVIADVETHFINWYERDYGIKVLPRDIIGKTESEAFPKDGAVHKFVVTPGFFRTAPVMKGAVEAVKKLTEHFEVYIVSAAMEFPLSLPEKLAWLNEHFPFISWQNIIFCGDKSVINTNFMIDDYPKNLDYHKGTPIMFTSFHNVNLNHHIRANNWDEVLELMEKER